MLASQTHVQLSMFVSRLTNVELLTVSPLFLLLYVVLELYYRSFLTCDIIDRLLICYSIVTYLSL